MTGHADTTLIYGYRLADLHRLARIATRHAGPGGSDYLDRYNIAWSAIAEHLYTVDQQPADQDLWPVGRDAIWQHIRDDRRTHGAGRNSDSHPGSMPSFRRYWWDHTAATPSPETRIVERLALTQIWPQLTPAHRAALTAYAAHGSIDTAATALHISYTAMANRLRRARQQAAELWHQHETPAAVWRRDYRPRTEHDHLRPCGTPTAYHRHRRRNEPVDDACRRAWTRYQAERAAVRRKSSAVAA